MSFIEFGFEEPTHKTLTVELVPSTAWGANLRSELPKKDWDKLRKAQYANAGNRCEICGGKGRKHPVECHEIWDYNDKTHVQTLTGLIALCPPCHRVKHLGFAFVKGRGQEAIAHLMKVNGWSPEDTQHYVEAVFEEHARRSKHRWTLDLEWLRSVGVDPP